MSELPFGQERSRQLPPWMSLHDRTTSDQSLAPLRHPSESLVGWIERIPVDGIAAIGHAWAALKDARHLTRSLEIDDMTRHAVESDFLEVKNALDRFRIEIESTMSDGGIFLLLAYLYARGRSRDLAVVNGLPQIPGNEGLADTVRMALAHKGVPTPIEPAAEIPEDLVNACVTGQCVFFAGPALSAQAGLPSVTELATGMLQHALSLGAVQTSLYTSLLNLLQRGDGNTVMEGLVDSSPQAAEAARTYLFEHLKSEAVVEHPLAVAFSSIRFIGVITTNLDDLLERTFHMGPLTIADTGALAESLTKNEFFLLKLYGELTRRNTALLTSAQYRDAVGRNQPFGVFLRTLFHSRTILFAGAPLKAVEEFLDSVPSRSESPPPHFALVATDESGWDVRAPSLERRFGLRIIPYDPGSDTGGLARSVHKLAECVNSRRPPQRPLLAMAPQKPPLAKVTLTNIGPFDHLELTFNAGWNVLLGDNGMGKSFVLKGIAAAIAGDEATPYAARLITIGKTNASVQLTTTAGDTYVLEILRSDSGVFLRSIPVRPLDKENWLALAFPPLRTISWDRAQGYDALAESRPVASDVLPLCQGEPDPRLDRLKSWLLWLDHNIMGAANDRYSRLRDEFYRVVSQVMPGMILGPGTVDAQKRQVFVRTSDGELPIESLSQGTQSLMGWIGVVLQRLFEIYRSDARPTERHALILMDEVDAHMHPRWQHALVETLSRILPNVQFIATSHSPLVISGLTREEVFIFRRDAEQRVRADHPDVDPKGWRVDQILTSLAFGLEGTRDSDTLRSIERYTQLASQEVPEDSGELARLARRLDVRLPTPIERMHARKAFEVMAAFAESQLTSMSSQDRQRVLDEIKLQIQEGMTGSRRPM